MAITAKQVNELRQRTGAGMMDCKKALTEANGDMEQAIDLLRKKGQKIAAKRADRDATEGRVVAETLENGTEGIAFSLNCETEPVRNTQEFQDIVDNLKKAALENKPASAEDLGNINIGGKTVQEQITELSGRIGEKIEIGSYAHIKGEKVVSYTHGTSIAVLVALKNAGDADVVDAGKGIAMQIAAMNPVAVDQDGVDQSILERERQVGVERAREEGKPENILERISEGYVKKFLKENTLLSQQYVKDHNMTVAQHLDSVNKGLTVTEFKRVAIGR
jgi:elongation factor Ts